MDGLTIQTTCLSYKEVVDSTVAGANFCLVSAESTLS